jgi:tRNA A-37 threonylcarbamoyl transferase component Bud32
MAKIILNGNEVILINMGNKKHHHKHKHFDIIHKDFGRGTHAKISIVKRRSDGELLIWKRPKRSNIYRHIESFRQEIKKSKYWRRFGVSQVRVFWHHDKISLLKTYIRGPTLKQMLEENPEFFSETESKPAKALGKLIRLLIDSGHYIADINRTNLIFDGDRWHIIDSSCIYGKTAFPNIRQKYKEAFFKSWHKSIPKNEKNSLLSFLHKYS